MDTKNDLPKRNYNLPVQKRSIATKDPLVEDEKGTIVPRQLNPWEEGTPQAFGGTAGKISEPDPNNLISPNETNVSNMNETDEGKNILHKKTVFDIKDYQNIMTMINNQKLNNLSDKISFDLRKKVENERFFNLSLSDIMKNTANVVVAVMIDILHYLELPEKSLNEFMVIFLKEERMIYFGVFLVMLSFLFMVVFLSS